MRVALDPHPICEHKAHIPTKEGDLATRIAPERDAARKTPRQARSRVTVEAILDAAAHILGERGWAGLTTNVVAEVAGVSIGSLYQYFPNKLALVEAVRRRHFEEVLAALRAGADEALARPARIAALAEGMIAAHSRYPAAYRVLIEESPRGEDARAFHDEFEVECRRAYEAIFKLNANGAGDVSIGAAVLAGALAGAVHEAARRDLLDSPILRREIVALVDAHLRTPRG
jgi:AcrR family transcriptional regulator